MRITRFAQLEKGEKFIIGPGSSEVAERQRFDPQYDYLLMEKTGEASVVICYNGLLMRNVSYLNDVPVIKVRS